MKQRILYVHHATGVGGAPISLRELIDSLDETRFEAEVLLLKDSIVREILETQGIKVSVAQGRFYERIYQFFPHLEPQYFRWWEVRKIIQYAVIWLLSRFYFAPRLLSNYEFDILHLNSSVLTDFLKGGQARGRTIIHIREPVARGYVGIRRRIIKREIERYADWVIAISRDNARRLGCLEKTSVVYNFTELNPRPAFDVPPKKVALYVGGANEIKGFLTLVDALDYLDPEITVWFCGYYGVQAALPQGWRRLLSDLRARMPASRRLGKAVEKIRNHPRARVLGLRLDIPELLRQSWVLVNPFTVEHFSRPVIEAFANGRTVIATDVDGMAEIVEHDVNGLIVPKTNPLALAHAINRICSDPELADKLAQAGYEVARKKFTKKNIEQVQSIYEQMI